MGHVRSRALAYLVITNHERRGAYAAVSLCCGVVSLCACADSKAGLKPADMEHIEELLARYQQEEQQGDTHVCRAAQGTQNQAGGVAGTSEQGAESGQTWALCHARSGAHLCS